MPGGGGDREMARLRLGIVNHHCGGIGDLECHVITHFRQLWYNKAVSAQVEDAPMLCILKR